MRQGRGETGHSLRLITQGAIAHASIKVGLGQERSIGTVCRYGKALDHLLDRTRWYDHATPTLYPHTAHREPSAPMPSSRSVPSGGPRRWRWCTSAVAESARCSTISSRWQCVSPGGQHHLSGIWVLLVYRRSVAVPSWARLGRSAAQQLCASWQVVSASSVACSDACS